VKKVLVCLALLGAVFGSGVPARAQSVGLRFGVNLADLAIDPTPPDGTSFDNLTGVTAGVFVRVPFGRTIGFQPEALFSMQGMKVTDHPAGQPSGMSATLKLDYLTFPLLGRIQFGPSSPVALLVGPSLGVRTRTTADTPGIQGDVPNEFSDTFKRFDVGLVIGVSADIGHFVIDGRYTWGLTNILKSDALGTDPSDAAKHRVFSFSAGFRF
jgi:outer membrane protein with beta-barrel domain